jgi:hypothetical protein
VRRTALAGLGFAALLLTGCGTTVTGTASPISSAPSGEATEPAEPTGIAGQPCELLTPEQATSLGYGEEGEFSPGRPEQLMPARCTWDPAAGDGDPLTAYFSVDISLADYVAGVQPDWEKDLGALTWEHYPDPLGLEGTCMLAAELSPLSFVALSSSDFLDTSKACERAEAAAPYVSANLSGG